MTLENFHQKDSDTKSVAVGADCSHSLHEATWGLQGRLPERGQSSAQNDLVDGTVDFGHTDIYHKADISNFLKSTRGTSQDSPSLDLPSLNVPSRHPSEKAGSAQGLPGDEYIDLSKGSHVLPGDNVIDFGDAKKMPLPGDTINER